MIKDDQGGTRNPYKCMNVVKQYAMDDKTKERCKICEKKNFSIRKMLCTQIPKHTLTQTLTKQV